MKYNGKAVVLTFRKLVELISGIQTVDDWNEAYALAEHSYQRGKITAADQVDLMLILDMIYKQFNK